MVNITTVYKIYKLSNINVDATLWNIYIDYEIIDILWYFAVPEGSIPIWWSWQLCGAQGHLVSSNAVTCQYFLRVSDHHFPAKSSAIFFSLKFTILSDRPRLLFRWHRKTNLGQGAAWRLHDPHGIPNISINSINPVLKQRLCPGD